MGHRNRGGLPDGQACRAALIDIGLDFHKTFSEKTPTPSYRSIPYSYRSHMEEAFLKALGEEKPLLVIRKLYPDICIVDRGDSS